MLDGRPIRTSDLGRGFGDSDRGFAVRLLLEAAAAARPSQVNLRFDLDVARSLILYALHLSKRTLDIISSGDVESSFLTDSGWLSHFGAT